MLAAAAPQQAVSECERDRRGLHTWSPVTTDTTVDRHGLAAQSRTRPWAGHMGDTTVASRTWEMSPRTLLSGVSLTSDL